MATTGDWTRDPGDALMTDGTYYAEARHPDGFPRVNGLLYDGDVLEEKRIHRVAEEQAVHDGQLIFREGSSGDWVYVVLSGAVEISKTIGGKKYIVGILQPGEVFGELGFIGKIKRTATARAVGETKLGIVDRQFLEEEYNRISSEFRTILEMVILRFTQLLDRASDFTKRAHPRVDKVLSVSFKDRRSLVKAYTANVGLGGLFLKTETPLEMGREFMLKLHLPGTKAPLPIKSQVVWVRKPEQAQPNRPSGMGVKFCEISKSDYQTLKQFLATAIPDG